MTTKTKYKPKYMVKIYIFCNIDLGCKFVLNVMSYFIWRWAGLGVIEENIKSRTLYRLYDVKFLKNTVVTTSYCHIWWLVWS